MLLSLHDNPFHAMKKTLFLALLTVPLVLSACAKNKGTTTSATPVTAAPQAVTEAPVSIAGKTLTISFQGAISRYWEAGEQTSWHPVGWSKWSSDIVTPEPITITFNNGNSHSKIVKDNSGRVTFNTSATYTKASSKTALVKYSHNDMVTDGSFSDYVLTFTSPSSGTVTWKGHEGDSEDEGKNATFIIK